MSRQSPTRLAKRAERKAARATAAAERRLLRVLAQGSELARVREQLRRDQARKGFLLAQCSQCKGDYSWDPYYYECPPNLCPRCDPNDAPIDLDTFDFEAKAKEHTEGT